MYDEDTILIVHPMMTLDRLTIGQSLHDKLMKNVSTLAPKL
jgi:hypothetical protein